MGRGLGRGDRAALQAAVDASWALRQGRDTLFAADPALQHPTLDDVLFWAVLVTLSIVLVIVIHFAYFGFCSTHLWYMFHSFLDHVWYMFGD